VTITGGTSPDNAVDLRVENGEKAIVHNEVTTDLHELIMLDNKEPYFQSRSLLGVYMGNYL
jgi:hypothetical protein